MGGPFYYPHRVKHCILHIELLLLSGSFYYSHRVKHYILHIELLLLSGSFYYCHRVNIKVFLLLSGSFYYCRRDSDRFGLIRCCCTVEKKISYLNISISSITTTGSPRVCSLISGNI